VRNPDLLRLNLGVFVLHTVQLSMWVAVPAMLVQAGLAKDHALAGVPAGRGAVVRGHGRPVCLERRGRLRGALLGAIGLMLLVQVGLGLLAASGGTPTLWVLGPLLFVFFCGFNALEASQPSLVSRMAPGPRCAARRWAATTRCSRWACLRAAPWAARWSNGRAPPACLPPRRCWRPCGWC
jgi:hypothetical protein